MTISYFFLEREMFQIEVVEKIRTHILCSVTFYKNCAVYEIMSENVVESEGPRMTSLAHTRRKLDKQGYTIAHACIRPRTRAPTRTHTHREKYVILTAFPQQQLLRECALMLHYT
jgi:hypothetical protein